jgi:hypothetical protein
MAENVKLYAIRSFYSRRDGMMTLEDDVLSVVAQVKELYGDRVTIELDPDTGWFHFVEHCEDLTDRLIFSVEELDARAMERLRLADSQSRTYQDPYLAAERAQDALQDELDEAMREKVRAEGERVAHALHKDGVTPRMPTKVFIPAGVRSLDA